MRGVVRTKMDVAVKGLQEFEAVSFKESPPKTFSYGTAGFREKSCLLDRVVFRAGVLAALRSKSTRATIGVVITASHNPEEDNGVKVVEPMGEMLALQWEGFASRLVNCRPEELLSVMEEIAEATGCDLSYPASVVFARDTRQSGLRLAELLIKSLDLMKAKHRDYDSSRVEQVPLKVDGANGVGALKLKELMPYILCSDSGLHLEIFNDGTKGLLNDKCGADHVKVNQAPPSGIHNMDDHTCNYNRPLQDQCHQTSDLDPDLKPACPQQHHHKCVSASTCSGSGNGNGNNGRFASMDGDADRLVYFYLDKGKQFRLLDGDKIASLVALYISEKLTVLSSDLTIGVVQTAYANGNSTRYLTQTLGVPVECVSTGVKHLHQKALEYDVGIYFEANGHGTVIFSAQAVETFQMAVEDTRLSPAQREAAKDLLALVDLINQAVGDAISDMLLVEIILMYKKWTFEMWDATYADLPNRQLKVKVADRALIKTTDSERRCTSPSELQDSIDRLVVSCACGRSFVRPSGTENVVRVYAEAETQEAADSLVVQVGLQVYSLAGGIGSHPKLS